MRRQGRGRGPLGDKFAPFAAALRRDTESVLSGYEIADKATKRNLLNSAADARLPRRTSRRRARPHRGGAALQDKPADKLLSGHRREGDDPGPAAAGRAATTTGVPSARRSSASVAACPTRVIENDSRAQGECRV
jgi:hypothetical protein